LNTWFSFPFHTPRPCCLGNRLRGPGMFTPALRHQQAIQPHCCYRGIHRCDADLSIQHQ
jgi:hypothetical protein